MPRETRKNQLEDDLTIASRASLPEIPVDDSAHPATISRSTLNAPWLLQQHFGGKIDLAVELANRYPTLPLITLIKAYGSKAAYQPAVAALSAPDGTATVLVEALPNSYQFQLAYTLGSMLTFRFRLHDLTAVDCAHWLQLIHREQDGVAFLWGQSRWEKDYLICTIRRQFASLYAFSPNGFEAGIRLTHEVKGELHDWLASIWNPDTASTGTTPNLLTW
ncbi:MAG: hypothetical protein LCI00_33505 [Chloroflexi bacterium]|nr:hypothetical protein [Chloroflexota bacterium]MCC6897066.1 hypothetical protein [Anaerolineae bacterium]